MRRLFRRGLFSAVRGLQELNLAENRLTRASAAPVFTLRSLQQLTLNGNPLGDLCDSGPDGTDSVYLRNGIKLIFVP